MVLGYHVIINAYGFWLPNDPRGSWSQWVRQWELLRFGPATGTSTRRSLAGQPHDQDAREQAKRALRYPPVRFTGQQAKSIGQGFARASNESGYTLYACAILPRHTHLVVGRCNRLIEQIVAHLKRRATQQLRADALHPMSDSPRDDGSLPSPWSEGMWAVYVNDAEQMLAAIEYVRNNPLKEGKPIQRWSFVSEYVG